MKHAEKQAQGFTKLLFWQKWR